MFFCHILWMCAMKNRNSGEVPVAKEEKTVLVNGFKVTNCDLNRKNDARNPSEILQKRALQKQRNTLPEQRPFLYM